MKRTHLALTFLFFFLFPISVLQAADASSSDRRTLRMAAEQDLDLLTQSLAAPAEKNEPLSEQHLQDVLSRLLQSIERYRQAGGITLDGQAFDNRWAALQASVGDVVRTNQIQLDNDVALVSLREKTRGAIMALSLNQKNSSVRQPPSLALLNAMDAQHEHVRQAEAAKMDSLRRFIMAWQQMQRLMTENPTVVPAALPVSRRETSIISPMGLTAFIFMGVGLFVFFLGREHMRQCLRPALQVLVRSVEAAASGDLSKRSTRFEKGLLGRLEAALNRLITVLAKSESRVYHWSTLVDSADEAIISQTMDGTISSWNKGAQRIFGYSIDEVRGKPLSGLFPEPFAAELKMKLAATAQGERVAPLEVSYEGRNGRRIHVFMRVSAIFDSTKQMIGTSLWGQSLAEVESLPRLQENPSVTEPGRVQ